MKATTQLFLATTLLGLSSPVLGQGADLCANAQPIAGLGVFAFDNTLATTDGGPDPLCDVFGQDSIEFDVWFAWTAPNDGTFIVDTCLQTTMDSKIGIYDGSCAGSVLACNDDACGTLQSQASWQAVAGQIYLIRLGNYPTAASGPGTGTMTITEDLPAMNPTNGHHYLLVESPGITWAAADAAAQTMSFGGATGHLATLTDQSENDFVFSLGDVHYYFVGGFQNLNSPNYAEPAGGWEWVTGEPWSYTNWWQPGEPNDSGINGPEHTLELLQGGQFGQSWNDVADTHSRGYIVEFDTGTTSPPGNALCYGDGSGATCPCNQFGFLGEGCGNTGGTGATLVGSGSASVGLDTFQIDIGGVPGAKPGLLVKGSNSFANPVGDGILCTSPQLRSHVQVTDASGTTTFTHFDSNPFGAISNMGGVPTYYQFWYRDPQNTCSGQGFNFTNAWETTWTP